MRLELRCPQCLCAFAAEPETPAAEVLDRMTEQGPWYALGDGETFEDMIFAALTSRGLIRCPECGDPVMVSEESLGRLTMEMLASW
jgi:DNA-directed RNA polymerase subunit RPC12/RpoP